MNVRTLPIRLRGALLYSAAWSPLVVFYTVILGNTAGQTPADAVGGAIRSVGWFALLGIGVVAIGRRWAWPAKATASLLFAHLALALAYAGLWDLAVILEITSSTHSITTALAIVRPWIFWQTFLSVLLYSAVLGITWAWRANERSREASALAQQADTLRVQAELSALRGQLDPHFLFNTLHSVSVLVQQDPAAAQRALERLAALLRYVLDSKRGARDDVTLAEELAFVDDYLALEGIRFGDRLRVVRDVSPAALDRRVPSFVLQTLVENAIKYAVAPRAAGGTVAMAGHLDGGSLVLRISDDGTDASGGSHGMGVGLETLRKRLLARYGTAAALDITAAPGRGFAVTMRLPS